MQKYVLDQSKYNYVSFADFSIYLDSLLSQQRNELYMLIENHPQVKIVNKDIIKYYKSQDRILRQLQYVIDLHKARLSTQSEGSSMQESYAIEQINRNLHDVHNWKINDKNYLHMIKEILSIKIINTNIYELELTEKKSAGIISQLEQDESLSFQVKNNNLIVTNYCQNAAKIFLVFKEYIQLVELQALIDAKWGLESIEIIISNFQQKKINFFFTPHQNKEFFFFKVTSTEIWQKLITNVNSRLKNSCKIVIKGSYLAQLQQFSQKLNERVKVAINENQLSFSNRQISQMKLLVPQKSVIAIKQQAIAVLTKNSVALYYEDYPIDPITNYNMISIEERKYEEVILIKPSTDNKKNFVYFLFYNVVMEIVRTQVGVELVQRKLSEEINAKFYKNSLQQIKKYCIKNRISFFYFPQNATFCKSINIKLLRKIKDNDINRLLYYRYRLNQQHYKTQLSPQISQQESQYILHNYQQSFTLKFQSQELLKKIGKMKSEQILRKYREEGVGCIQAKIGFCKLIVQRQLQESGSI